MVNQCAGAYRSSELREYVNRGRQIAVHPVFLDRMVFKSMELCG